MRASSSSANPPHSPRARTRSYHLTLFTDPDREESVRQFVMARLPGTILESALKGCLVFRVPRMAYGSESVMGDFFRALELNKEALCIRDVSVGLTTLEEVFLHLAHLQEEAQRAMEQAGDNASRPFPPVAPEEAGLPPLPSLLSGEGAAEVGTFAALMQSASASSLISRTPRSPPGAAGITAAAAAAGVGPAALARQASAARVAAAANAGADAAEAAAAGAALEAEEEGSDDLGRDSDDEEREMLLSDEEGGFARSAAQQLVANDLEMGTPGQRGARGFVPKCVSLPSTCRRLAHLCVCAPAPVLMPHAADSPSGARCAPCRTRLPPTRRASSARCAARCCSRCWPSCCWWWCST